MDLPPLSAIRAFDSAARHLSFSKAGDELFVTHAAISHQIRNLEAWFDTALFLRKGRGVALTRSGEMLFRQVAPALAEIGEACSRVKALGGKESLTVGCIPSIASRWLIPNLNRFTTSHPACDVRVEYASAHQKLSGSGMDVLITLGAEDTAGIRSERLFSRLTKPVCSPSFLAEFGPLDTPAAIAKVPLLHDETREGWRDWFQTARTPWSGADSWPVYQDFNLLVIAAIAGHGVALCPVDTFRVEIERGDLIVLSEIATNEEAAYFASHRSTVSPAALEFVDWFTTFIAAT
ncbi:LysR substrate-binding domain-containing protein [Arenibacterium sp. LLYu02]|uniref:LysR substrate-binding domain-containing protein n=1 Tax=Arenibacterium sp. LLYu02 TaxID=3404132 RepID=UPI003B2171D9